MVGVSVGDADWFGLLFRWIHFLAGIVWIGLLYFFNLINAAFLKSLDGPTKNIVIPKLMPAALNWFRHGATVTVLAGIVLYFWLYSTRWNRRDRAGNRRAVGHHHDGQCPRDYLAEPKEDYCGGDGGSPGDPCAGGNGSMGSDRAPRSRESTLCCQFRCCYSWEPAVTSSKTVCDCRRESPPASPFTFLLPTFSVPAICSDGPYAQFRIGHWP